MHNNNNSSIGRTMRGSSYPHQLEKKILVSNGISPISFLKQNNSFPNK